MRKPFTKALVLDSITPAPSKPTPSPLTSEIARFYAPHSIYYRPDAIVGPINRGLCPLNTGCTKIKLSPLGAAGSDRFLTAEYKAFRWNQRGGDQAGTG